VTATLAASTGLAIPHFDRNREEVAAATGGEGFAGHGALLGRGAGPQARID
jgi:hypothetical protein